MFALRSLAKQFNNEAGSMRHIGGTEEEEDGDYGNKIAVSASKVSAIASVGSDNSSGEHDLLKNCDAFVSVLKDLKREERQQIGQPLNATVNLEANIGLSGSSADSVASAVKTTSFLFEQLLGDLDAVVTGKRTKADKDRYDLMEGFHAMMTDSLAQLTSRMHLDSTDEETVRVATTLEQDLSSAEALLADGPEAYIASIRKLIEKDFEDTVNVWYRGLKYDAHLPVGNKVATNKYNTIGSQLYGMTLGPFMRLGHTLCGDESNSGDVDGDNVNSYSRLDSGDNDTEFNGGGGLTHTLSSGRFRIKPVLKGLTGVLRSGRLALVMGPPGCGKTSFLKAISGQLHKQKGVSARVSGELRYNYLAVEQLKNLANWAAYVSQVDEHMPLLTVRETLQFAYNCRKSARVYDPNVFRIMVERLGQKAAERVRALQQFEVEFVLAVLGLTQCADTVIGNETLKGISGGEKRRVTLGEMLVTGAQVVALDEISTGLDSAATFDICRFLSASAHFMGQCIVVALLQPPPEVIDLFDDLVLLAEGNVIYHGPRENVADYFEKLGYKCPPRKDLGDFLQELPTASGSAFLLSEDKRKAIGAPARPPRTADEFGLAWKQSSEGQAADEAVAREAKHQFETEQTRSEQGGWAQLTWDNMPGNSFLNELRFVLAWTWKLKLSKTAEIVSRVFQNVFMGFVFGSLFWQIGFDEWYLKFMLLANMPGFMQAGGISLVPSLVIERPVMYKQTAAKFYSGTIFALAQFLVSVPFTMFDAFMFGNLLYWMCGLVHDLERYLVFISLAILFGLQINQMMRVFAYSVQNQESALVFAILTYLTFVIFSGQLATPEVIPSYLQWVYYINPLAWTYKAMVINEFKASYYDANPCHYTFEGQSLNVPQRCGDFFLENRQFSTNEADVGKTIIILTAYLIGCLLLTMFLASRRRFDRGYTEEDGDAELQEAEAYKHARDGCGGNNRNDDVDVDVSSMPNKTSFGRSESLIVENRTLVFNNVWYTIHLDHNAETDNNTVDLLKGISGWALPGRMTALMGSSGAGKTTLLDVLADCKTTGTITGCILVNGSPPNPATFRKIVGYVKQFGVHAQQATVKESLTFSASLRLPPHQQHKVKSFVEETMALLELDTIEHELTRDLSVEQNKRLTIAVELVSNPSILFADEPTSGLDARSASIVMRSIQNVARSGRTVICTVHQPSIVVFNMFDDLLLMRRGGSVVFFGELGENSVNLIKYFEAVPGTAPCPVGYNPSTWMLEVIGAGTGTGPATVGAVDFAAVYRKSKLAQNNLKRLKYEFFAPGSHDASLPVSPNSRAASFSSLSGTAMATDTSFDADVSIDMNALVTPVRRQLLQNHQVNMRRAMVRHEDIPVPVSTTSFSKQVWLLLKRQHFTYWRSPEFSLSRLLVIMLVSVIIALCFWQQTYATAADVQSRISAVSFIIFLAGAFNLFQIMPFTIERRALFYREVGSGMYMRLASVLADTLVEVPYLVVETLIGVNIVYWGVGFNGDLGAYVFYGSVFFLYIFLMTSLGMFFAVLLPDAQSAQLVASVALNVFQLFAGVVVPKTKLPVYYKFLYYFSPQMYCLEGLVTTQFHNDDTTVCNPKGIPVHTDNPFIKRILEGKVCTDDGQVPPGFNLFDNSTHTFTGQVVSAESFVLDQFLIGYKYEHRYTDLLVLITWIIIIRIITSITVVFLDHNKA